MPSPARQAANSAQRRFAPGQVITRQAQQSASDPYEFVMATGAVDRVGDIIEIDGMDIAAFKQNPIALWAHDPRSPIGKWEAVRKSAGQLIGKLRLAEPGTSPLIDRLRDLIEQRILQAVSVGFRMLEAEPVAKDSWGLRFLKSELMECSLVSVPANAEARRKSLAPHPADDIIFANPAGSDRQARIRAGAASQRRQLASGQGTPIMPRTIAERITALQTRSVTIDDELNQIQEAAANDDDRDFTDEETTQIDALTAEKSSVVANLETLSKLENSMALKAQPLALVPASERARLPARAEKKEEPGAMLWKLGVVNCFAHVTKQPIERIIATRYANDDRVAACANYLAMRAKSATNIADTTTPDWAGVLVREQVGEFMADLEALSIFAAIRARSATRAISFDGVGSIKIPNRTNRGNLAGAWVGETGVIPVLQGSFGAQTLEPTKLAGITTFSKELMSASNETIEGLLRDGLRIDTAEVLDKALLDNRPRVAGVRPAGLQVGANSAPSSGNGPDDIKADLSAALGPILAAKGGRDIVILVNPLQGLGIEFSTNMLGMPAFPEFVNGQLQRRTVIESVNVPVNTVFVMDVADFASAADVPDFAVSEEATLTMANADGTAPTQAITAAGAIGPVGEVLPDGGIHVTGGASGAGTAGFVAMSMFQQWSVALRMVLPVNWAMLREDMISVITDVHWGEAEVTP